METFTNSAEYGIISQKDFFENNISKVEKLDRYYVVEPEDFVYNPRISINAPVGPINRNTLDRCGVMSPLYSVFKTHNIDNTYLEYFFKSNYWHSFMFFNGDSGARSDRFSIKDTVFMEMPIPYPNIYEQSKIGVFLKQLDNDITLHQRKLEKLGNIKKSMLEKMFPKDENKVPEIRFKGFNDDWEQRYIEDIASFSKGNGYSKSDLSNNGNPIILYGRLYTNYEFCIDKVNTYSKIKKGSVLSQGNEVIVPSSGETSEDIARASAIIKKGILIGGDLNIIRPIEIVESCFLALAISNGKTQKDLSSKAQGKSVVHIHNSDIKKIQVSFPKVKEQEKIIKLFKFIDNLISLHQRKPIFGNGGN